MSFANTDRHTPTRDTASATHAWSWGTSWRQRLRLLPLYLSICGAERLSGSFRRAHAMPRALPTWRPGLSVIIPERDAPQMLLQALHSLYDALAAVDEPRQVIVVANGAPRETYAEIMARFPAVELVHCRGALGFSAAIRRGLRRARHDWTFLMNNDVTLDRDTLWQLARCRHADVFAVAAQIMQKSASGRREETGFTDWYADETGVRVFHADPGSEVAVRDHLCASGGAALFRTRLLRRYVRDSGCYDPFYWEDVEWGVRAWQDGLRVRFCGAARVWHRHRATTARFYAEPELARIVERNRILFDARNAVSDRPPAWLLKRVCDLPYESQRELARWRVAWQVLHRRSRVRHAAAPAPPRLGGGSRTVIDVPPASYSYRLRPNHGSINALRPRLLVITPFAVFPPRHGGARRTSGLLRGLRENFDIILVSDEASGYDARSFTDFDGLFGVRLVQRRDAGRAARKTTLAGRMEEHQHDVLVRAVSDALDRYRPDVVHIEHIELAGLVRYRRPGQRWVLGLHDAYAAADFDDVAQAARFRTETLARYDAVTACSPEDCALISHQRIVCVPNGTSIDADGYSPSQFMTLLFMGPFRYALNLDGIRRFLRVAYPAIRDAVPAVQLKVLGGNGASDATRDDDAFAQAGVEVLEHREDVVQLLQASALTINPLQGIRGSAIKVIESLTAGRVCVSTVEGARGFRDAAFSGLVTVDTIEQMVGPIISLLRNSAERHRREQPIASQLAPYQWQHCAAIQRSLYTELLASRS